MAFYNRAVITFALVTGAAGTARSHFPGVDDPGADLADIGKGTDGVFETVASRVSALEAQLSQTELDNHQKLVAREAHYQQQVADTTKANDLMEKGNKALEEEVEELRKSTVELRTKAQGIQADIQNWAEDWQAMQNNITTALEVTNGTLEEIHRQKDAPVTHVLAELRREDEEYAEKLRHTNRLKAVSHTAGQRDPMDGDGLLSLLQVRQPAGGSPMSMLRVLDASLEDLAREHEQKEAQLKAKYSSSFKMQQQRATRLEQQRAQTQRRKEGLVQLQERLKVAVKYLEDHRSRLETQGRSIRMYAQRLGIRPIPHHNKAPLAEDIAASTEESSEFDGSDKDDEDAEATKHQAKSVPSFDRLARTPRDSRDDFDEAGDVEADRAADATAEAPKSKASFLSFLSELRAK